MGTEVKLDRPALKLNFELDDVTLGINRYQFTSILDILQYFALYARGLKVRYLAGFSDGKRTKKFRFPLIFSCQAFNYRVFAY
jgi:hypothetical protein